MVLGFKKRFEPKIVDGSKIHTIREDEKDRWKKGMLVHFATGTRTPNYNCFMKSEVKSVQRIFMSLEIDGVHVSIDGTELCYTDQKHALAISDGFDSWTDFEDYWEPVLAKREYQSFSGKVIHWTEFRY